MPRNSIVTDPPFQGPQQPSRAFGQIQGMHEPSIHERLTDKPQLTELEQQDPIAWVIRKAKLDDPFGIGQNAGGFSPASLGGAAQGAEGLAEDLAPAAAGLKDSAVKGLKGAMGMGKAAANAAGVDAKDMLRRASDFVGREGPAQVSKIDRFKANEAASNELGDWIQDVYGADWKPKGNGTFKGK